METHSDRRKLATIALSASGVSLDEAVHALRAQGLGWRAVSNALKDQYGVSLPYATLWRWFGSEHENAA